MARRLALIAGSGQVVPLLVEALRNRGDELLLIDLVGRTDLAGPPAERIPLADTSAILERLRTFRPQQALLAGGVHITQAEREGIARAFGTLGRFSRSLGDLGLAGLIWLQAQSLGIKLVGAHDVLPELVAGEGLIGGPAPDAATLALARRALGMARRIGATDLGQAVVMAGRRPVAAEDAGGTDALLARVAALRSAGLVGDGRAPLLLAKALKPRQPKFVDLPTIGPATVTGAAAAGVRVIAVEAGRSLVIDRQVLVAAAAAHEIAVVGLRHG